MFKPTDFADYQSRFPEDIRGRLERIRTIIQKAAPKAKEVISYAMPAFKQHGVLVYFAAYEKHIGFYPTSSGIEIFKKELDPYVWSKGAIQFPHDKPLPVGLITKIIKFRVKEDQEKADQKKARPKKK